MDDADPKEIGLEDFHEDILGKAMRGLGIGKREMASRLKVEKSEIDDILSGACNEVLIAGMADELSLCKSKLLVSARKEWSPSAIQLFGLKQFNLPFGSMDVNVFLAWDQEDGKSWIFDTGPDATPILEFLKKENLSVDAIFLTHTHGDHIACLEKLKQKTHNPPVFVHKFEPIEGVNLIDEGFERQTGCLSLKSLHTHGHSAGGTTYLLNGLDEAVAVVGDSLFAGSMGGGMVSYKNAIQNNREKLMTLPERTVVCPGHGPMTTIAEEKAHNPFFP
jgi:glyoxylase-like metal-dependent hydrolase (beta-lactamase superfamily II)